MRNLVTIILVIFSCFIAACSKLPPPTTAKHVDLKRYTGRWYEIASFPNYFQRGCRCTFAEYGLDGKYISVTNRCIKGTNTTYSKATAKAWVPNPKHPAKLKVQFFWPFRANYWILYLDSNYRYALVGTPNRKYLWILSRTKTLPNSTYQKLLKIAQQKGYDTARFNRTLQNCH